MSFRLGPVPSSAKSTQSPKHSKSDSRNGSSCSIEEQTITATIQLLKSGCLPGDNLPLKISIKHTKPIKSMHGIIVTLYRQGRIDSAPPLSLFVDLKGKEVERLKHEEYYPKSKTGLGGLSLSSAGSSSMFRKDLTQTFAPILVDPITLSAVVHASVRVPEDVFPTISGVPGQMISFKYYVEVVVDLGGKLASQQRHLPRLGTVSLASTYGNSSAIRGDSNPNIVAAYGGSIVETDHIRREKGVVAPVFEVVIGTVDSARVRGRAQSSAKKEMGDWNEESSAQPTAAQKMSYEEAFPSYEAGQDPARQPYQYPYYDQSHEDQNHEYYSDEAYDYQVLYPEQGPPPAHNHVTVPPPDIQAEEGLSEKERVRRAEERLLPSQPPIAVPGASSSNALVLPSIPPAELDLYGAEDATPPALSNGFHPYSSAISADATLAPSAPALEDLTPTNTQTLDDKQELERRRLLAEASAPSGPPADEEDNAGEGSSSQHFEPSAPILTDDDYGEQYTQQGFLGLSHRETLPKYER
jgi:arrestin-related trafficking adapter 9